MGIAGTHSHSEALLLEDEETIRRFKPLLRLILVPSELGLVLPNPAHPLTFASMTALDFPCRISLTAYLKKAKVR
jgi:hypothetical protein